VSEQHDYVEGLTKRKYRFIPRVSTERSSHAELKLTKRRSGQVTGQATGIGMGEKKSGKERAKSLADRLSKEAPHSPSVTARLSPFHNPFAFQSADASNPNLLELGRPNRAQRSTRKDEGGEQEIGVLRADMGPTIPANENGTPGPHPSYIEIAKPYIFEQKLQEHMTRIGMSEAKESEVRLRGITWIDSTRRALQL